MRLQEVDAWLRAQGISPRTLSEIHYSAFLLSVSRLLQAVFIEQFPTGCELDDGGNEGPWLIVGHEQALRVPVTRPLPFSRMEATGQPVLFEGDSRRELTSPDEFLAVFAQALGETHKGLFAGLCEDFENSYANLVLNRGMWHLFQDSGTPIEPSYAGHEYYPFPALRVGPSLSQVASCSNLSPVPASLPLVGIRPHQFVSLRFEDDAELFHQWSGLAAQEWQSGLIPLHPWQLELSSVVRSAASLGYLELTPHRVAAVPLASQRTCRILATGYDVKLPIDATLTGERRLLYPANAMNAPIISDLAWQLLRADGRETLDFQLDVAAYVHEDRLIGTHLAAIIRSPQPRRGPGHLVPALSLWTGKACAGAVLSLDTDEAAYSLFLAYCRVVLSGPVEFYARWGLAFEPHLQNSLIYIENGLPAQLVLRDMDATILDGDRIPQLLRLYGLVLPVPAWQSMPAFTTAGQRLLYALLPGHLGSVMAYLIRERGLDPETLRHTVDDVWSELHLTNTGVARQYVAALHTMSLPVKRLLHCRLHRSMELAFAN